jgi:hypothetical protein
VCFIVFAGCQSPAAALIAPWRSPRSPQELCIVHSKLLRRMQLWQRRCARLLTGITLPLSVKDSPSRPLWEAELNCSRFSRYVTPQMSTFQIFSRPIYGKVCQVSVGNNTGLCREQFENSPLLVVRFCASTLRRTCSVLSPISALQLRIVLNCLFSVPCRFWRVHSAG